MYNLGVLHPVNLKCMSRWGQGGIQHTARPLEEAFTGSSRKKRKRERGMAPCAVSSTQRLQNGKPSLTAGPLIPIPCIRPGGPAYQ